MSQPDPSIPLPKDPRHQRFADLVLIGEPAAKAYKEAGFTAKSPQSRAANASRLLKRRDVCAYMAAVRGQAAKGTVATLQYKREFLFEIMDTPLWAIDPDDPGRQHGRLLKKVKRRYRTGDDEIEYCFEEIEKHCPLKAIEIDNKLSGDDPESNFYDSFREALSALNEGPLPTGKM
jgi:hypothetical protein